MNFLKKVLTLILGFVKIYIERNVRRQDTMQEFEFVDNGIFKKNGKDYLNKGQIVINDITYYFYISADVPYFAGLYLPNKEKFIVIAVTAENKGREATEEERTLLQCKCKRCVNCGEVIAKEDGTIVDGDTLCADCYENLLGEEIEICDICGCAHFSDNDRMIYIQEEEQLICDECAERHYFQCSNCGTWTKEPLLMTDGDYICNECFETGDYYICDDCGDVIDPDTESVIIRSDSSVCCEDCASEHTDPNEEYIHEYGYSPRILFNEGEELNSYPKKGERYFGLEIETECTGDITEVIENENYYWATDDSSIQCLQGGCAAEIVTQPTTFKAWHNYSDAFFDALENNCDTNTSCGLHIHVNRNSVSDETIEKAMLFISKHYEKIAIFADRLMCNIRSYAGNNLEHYKDYYPNSKSVKEEINIIKKGKDNVRYKYLAINTLHKNTYEFRIFNSTVEKNRILAYIEFVEALLEYCSENNFLQICKSDFLDLNKYAEGWDKYKNLTHRFSVLNQEL